MLRSQLLPLSLLLPLPALAAQLQAAAATLAPDGSSGRLGSRLQPGAQSASQGERCRQALLLRPRQVTKGQMQCRTASGAASRRAVEQ